jgi:hypothetical protein
MLLLDVQVDIDPSKEALLNEWYHAHVPRLLSVPGYDSGRRYAAMTPGPRYLALYEIRSESYLPSLLGSDKSLRHELTLSEWARWDRDLVPHMSHCKTNVYKARDDLCLPLIRADSAIVMIRLDEHDADRERTRRIVGDAIGKLLVADAEVLGVRLLERAREDAIVWLDTSPELLLLAECAGPRAARSLAVGKGTARAFLQSLVTVGGVEPRATAYQIIARHWPLTKGSVHVD